jgi:hypothetical protein
MFLQNLPTHEYIGPYFLSHVVLRFLPSDLLGLLSSILLENSLYFGVDEIISYQKLVGNLDKIIVANLGRQHHRSLNSYFKSS